MDHTFDKTLWKKVRFSDVADEHKETINGQKIQLKFYVGLDHIESESLHLTKWGNLSEGVSFSKVFRKDQILFGRRRSYQKKVAIAPFDGVCSGDILIFKPKAEVIHPQFFPFVIQNDRFFDYAMQTSAGSLSPRTKFKDLANFEFLLPPLDQQKDLVELLWSGDNQIIQYQKLENKLSTLISIEIDNLIWQKKYSTFSLCNITLDKKFIDGDWIENKDMSESGIRLIQLADIGENEFINKSKRFISEETFSRLNCFELLPGDLLMARMPDPIGRTCEIPDINEKMITAVDCCIIRVDEARHNKQFWLFFLNSTKMKSSYEKVSSGTTRQRISKRNLEQILVPMPDFKTQNIITNKLSIIKNAINYCNLQISNLRKLNKNIINEIYSI